MTLLLFLFYVLPVLIVSSLPLTVALVLLEPSSFAVIFFCGNLSGTPCTRKGLAIHILCIMQQLKIFDTGLNQGCLKMINRFVALELES